RLAPATRVGRAREPVAPEPHRLVEHREDLLWADRPPRRVSRSRLQDGPRHVAGLALPGRSDVAVMQLDGEGRTQQEVAALGPEERTLVGLRQLVRRPAVVEARRALGDEPHLTADDADDPDQAVMGRRALRIF